MQRTLGDILTGILATARTEAPRAQAVGPVWFGMKARNHAKAHALATRPMHEPAGERLTGHRHDLVAVTMNTHAFVRCAVPGCAHAATEAL